MRRLALCLIALAGGCRTLSPELDHEERAAARVKLGVHPESDAAAAEARGEVALALRLRRAIVLAKPTDVRARRELFRVGLAAGQARRAGLDAVDFVWLAPDRAAASEEVARLYLAARLPLEGIPWVRRAIGYGGVLVTTRLYLLLELAEAAGDQTGASEVRRELEGR